MRNEGKSISAFVWRVAQSVMVVVCASTSGSVCRPWGRRNRCASRAGLRGREVLGGDGQHGSREMFRLIPTPGIMLPPGITRRPRLRPASGVLDPQEIMAAQEQPPGREHSVMTAGTRACSIEEGSMIAADQRQWASVRAAMHPNA